VIGDALQVLVAWVGAVSPARNPSEKTRLEHHAQTIEPGQASCGNYSTRGRQRDWAG
jgi:hypothetical protein